MNANPLSDTERTVATTASVTATAPGAPNASATVNAARPAVTEIATPRSGFILEPTLSETAPATIRATAPSTWLTVTTTPAETADQPCPSTSHASRNACSMPCGSTNSTEAPCTRCR